MERLNYFIKQEYDENAIFSWEKKRIFAQNDVFF